MTPPTDPHEEQAREFAHKINHLLEEAAVGGDYELLALVAPPHFLGLLHSGIKPTASKRLALHRANDLTQMNHTELEHHLAEMLRYPYAEVETPNNPCSLQLAALHGVGKPPIPCRVYHHFLNRSATDLLHQSGFQVSVH